MVNPKTNRVLENELDDYYDDDDDGDENDDDEDDEGTDRPLEEGETVLAVPVVGLVLHPVKPGHDDDDGRFDENEPDQVISAPL